MKDLILACYNNDKEAVERILKSKKIDVNYRGDHGETAIQWAYYKGNKAIIELLKQNGANDEIKDNDGLTCIHYACCGNQIQMLREFLDNQIISNGDVNILDKYNRTFLHFAASGGFNSMVDLILDRNFNINAIDEDGRTPLNYAIYHKREDVAKNLIKKGASIDYRDFKDKQKLLYLVCETDRLDILDNLILQGIDLNKKDNDGLLPIQIACLNGSISIVQKLIDKVDQETKQSLIYYAVFSDCLKLINFLYEKIPVNLNRNFEDETLGRLARKRRIILGKDDFVLIRIATKLGYRKVVDFFIRKGADVARIKNIIIDGESIAHLVCINGNIEQMNRLVQLNVDINCYDSYGILPIQYAVLCGRKDIVELLLQKNIGRSLDWVRNMKITYIGDSTLLHLAIKYMRLDIVGEILKEFLENKYYIIKNDKIVEQEITQSEKCRKLILNSKDEKKSTPLENACKMYIAAIKMLISEIKTDEKTNALLDENTCISRIIINKVNEDKNIRGLNKRIVYTSEMIKMLIRAGAVLCGIEQENIARKTLKYAMKMGDIELVDLLQGKMKMAENHIQTNIPMENNCGNYNKSMLK